MGAPLQEDSNHQPLWGFGVLGWSTTGLSRAHLPPDRSLRGRRSLALQLGAWEHNRTTHDFGDSNRSFHYDWADRRNLSTPRDRLSKFLEHLDAIFRTEPEFFPFESKIPGSANLACMVYRDIPEADHVTGVTYGLSEVVHPSWRSARPELIISLQSTDIAWPLAVAEMANRLRGQCPFGYGDIIDFGGKISEESEMSAFLVFTPSILGPNTALGIDVGAEQPINIAGMYPIYGSECALITKMGLEQFWKHPNFDRYDVHRAAVDADRGSSQPP